MRYKRYIAKEDVWIEESVARLLGINGEVVEQWTDEDNLAAKVFEPISRAG